MFDLHDLSSNLLLIGFVLISICCLYLLYTNFTKVRDINEMKTKFEDLKTIFFNQQKQNDESYLKIMQILQDDVQNLAEVKVSPGNNSINNNSINNNNNNKFKNDMNINSLQTNINNSNLANITTITSKLRMNIHFFIHIYSILYFILN
jgi:hypothetical protein